MKKNTLLYLPLIFLFIFASAAFIQHINQISVFLPGLISPSQTVRIPFTLNENLIVQLLPEAEEAGLKEGDKPIAVNGRELTGGRILFEELNKATVGENVIYTVERKSDDGSTIKKDIAVRGYGIVTTFRQWISALLINLIYLVLFPFTAFILGFYVAFVRPRDPVAWFLLLTLLGIGSIALENGKAGSVSRVFQESAMNLVGVWVILFGIYFPERLSFDKKYPFAKWILLAPLILTGSLNLVEQFGRFFDLRWLWETVDKTTERFDNWVGLLTLLGMGIFFACLAYKSRTLENKDSRRRLRILFTGTFLAMLPTLCIVLFRILTGRNGSFFEIVPWWAAVYALISLLLFPLTMAYVIVVHRAMDVSVVIRQGLQYALARNGVKVLQFILMMLIILGIIAIFRNSGEISTLEQIGFIACGFALIPVIEYLVKKMRVWIDKKFFREAYNAEQILAELSENVRTMVETKPLLETVSTKISESLHVPQIALLLKNGNEFQPAYSIGYENFPPVELSENDKTIEKLKQNEPLTIYQDEQDSWVNDEIETSEREKLQQLNSQLLLPIGAKDKLAGLISLSPKKSEEPYTPNDLRLLKSVAVQTGLALENSRLTEAIVSETAQRERLNREVEIAREVQERLFPQELPKIEGFDYYGACRPALGVGGDYYDFLELPDNKFGIAIGDVSGKGIGASLMMASLQASLRGQAIHCGNDLAELMKHVNTLVYEASTSNRYATFFYAQLDTKTKKMIYVNAGHNPPFLLRKNGEVLRLEDGGAVVGMLPSMFVNYSQGEIQLESGDLLVGSTDGITEAMNPQEEEWSEDAMFEEVKKVSEKTAEEILKYIVEKADEFANGAKQHDDMTMIVLKVN